MNLALQKIGLPRTFAAYHSPANRKGVRYVLRSQGGGAARFCLLCSIHAPYFPEGGHPDDWRDPFCAPTHCHRHPADPRAAGQGTLELFSSRPLSLLLVQLAIGQGACGDGAGIDPAGPTGDLPDRRHQPSAQGQARLRQREASRCLTDVSLAPKEIVSLFTGRWSIEVTFQEVRTHL